MKKKYFILMLSFLTVFVLSCSTKNNQEITKQSNIVSADTSGPMILSSEKLDSIVDVVVNVSANDFYKNQQPPPTDFMNVNLKFIKKDNGEELYILCGQFITSDKQEIPFATVKNSDYEQWVGSSALTYCQNSKEILYSKTNLSTVLKNKIESLRKK